MENSKRQHGATQDQIEFWMLVHQTVERFADEGGREKAARCDWPEQNVHDAFAVQHAIAHAQMAAYGFTPWPDCPLGDGSSVAEQLGWPVVIEVDLT